ncbi:MAG: Tryptophan synthase alpha chain [Acidobacteria bacterium]|nr:Tryptophan synthase alpha chain [Acidobacteriota bacterium]
MSRIAESFSQLKRTGKKGFIPFITAGDPDLDTTRELLIELSRAGATIIELGVPFSDPMADGPVIQRASERALRHRFGLEEILAMTSEARALMDTPIVLFSYFNPLLQFGTRRVAEAAGRAGIDGVLVTDLIPEEAGEFASSLRAEGLDMIFLVAPTSTDARLEMVAARASGFIYAVSRAGVTGTRASISNEAEKLVRRVKRFSNLPVAVGFGISTAEQVAEVCRYADAAVVGSAIVAEIERSNGAPDLVRHIGEFAKALTNSVV